MINSVSGVGSYEPIYATVNKKKTSNNAEAGSINNKIPTMTKTPPDIEKIKNMLHMLSGAKKDLIKSECAYATLDISVLDNKFNDTEKERFDRLPKVEQSPSIANFQMKTFFNRFASVENDIHGVKIDEKFKEGTLKSENRFTVLKDIVDFFKNIFSKSQ